MLDFVTMAWVVLLAGGGYTWGYFFLRYGWPKVRILDDQYKLGWSILLGSGYFIIAAALIALSTWGTQSLFSPFLSLGGLSLAGLPIAIVLLFAYRQFFTSRVVKVSVAKEVVEAHDTADRLVEKMSNSKGIVNEELTRKQLEEIKRALAKALEERD